MGIPAYMSYILRTYPQLIKPLEYHKNQSTEMDCLFMDSNSIIYDVFNRIKKTDIYDKFINKRANEGASKELEEIIIQQVIEKIEEYVLKINPTQLVFIAFDGVAPFAKMGQQRIRRFKNWYSSSFLTLKEDISWNTSSITPGTLFMNTLTRTIQSHFYNPKYNKKNMPKFIVSGSDEVGEGEQKIFKYIRSHEELRNILVYGLDSDLIMLSIFHCTPLRKLFVFREEIEFQKPVIEKESSLLFIDMNGLSDSILYEMGGGNIHRVYDYLFLCFFLGNDFLPHFPCLNIRTDGIQTLMTYYKNVIGKYDDRSFISNGKIQWKWFKLFVEKLSQNEKQLFLNEHSARDKMDYYKWNQTTLEEKENVLHNVPVIFRAEEKYICPKERNWEERYYKVLLETERTRNSTREISTNILEGFEWVFKYYTTDCPDWKWKYRYHYPPLLVDMVRFIPNTATDFICPSERGMRPFTPQLQLAYVLPPENHYLLDKKKGEYLKKRGELYPSKIEYIWAYNRYFFECKIKEKTGVESWEKVEEEWC